MYLIKTLSGTTQDLTWHTGRLLQQALSTRWVALQLFCELSEKPKFSMWKSANQMLFRRTRTFPPDAGVFLRNQQTSQPATSDWWDFYFFKFATIDFLNHRWRRTTSGGTSLTSPGRTRSTCWKVRARAPSLSGTPTPSQTPSAWPWRCSSPTLNLYQDFQLSQVATPPQNGQQQRSNGQQSSEELVRLS